MRLEGSLPAPLAGSPACAVAPYKLLFTESAADAPIARLVTPAGVLLGPLLMVSAALGSLAAGVPIWVLPAPLLAAAGLSMFYDTRTLRDYLLFVAGGLLTGAAGGAAAVWGAGMLLWGVDGRS